MPAVAVKRKIIEVTPSSLPPTKKRKDVDLDQKTANAAKNSSESKQFVKKPLPNNAATSREAHAKQKVLANERRAAKPNADSIQRAKKLWERLRRKSHVPKEERDQLIQELFNIVTGHVKDFVFKHDSVRVIQCALKYANAEQRKTIASELRGDYKALAESRYAKFLVGKLLVQADEEAREWIIGEFYGAVKRLINHPEASWILDDTYRGIATPAQKTVLLREWYGTEFALFKSKKGEAEQDADLARILKANPEKRSSIMSYLQGLINQLVQKKMTGFTMLHDAMLQYFLNTAPGTEEATEFLELLKGDEEGDLLKNLAFTSSGSKIVCYALAYGNAKDRKNILRVYKDHIETLAFDPNGHLVLLAAYDLIDDTVMTSKLIFPELLGITMTSENQQARILNLANHITARIPLLYPFAAGNKPGTAAKWLIPARSPTANLLASLHAIRASTSKKDPETRRKELVKAMSSPPALISTIAALAEEFVASSFGCQFVAEVLLDADGDKTNVIEAIAALTAGDPNTDGHISSSAAAGRMLKTLVLGGRFDLTTNAVVLVNPPLGFADIAFGFVKDYVVDWAVGESSFVVLSLLEAHDFSQKRELLKVLKNERRRLEEAKNLGNKGAAMILDNLIKNQG